MTKTQKPNGIIVNRWDENFWANDIGNSLIGDTKNSKASCPQEIFPRPRGQNHAYKTKSSNNSSKRCDFNINYETEGKSLKLF